jgi:hypothetical protein
MNTVIQAMFEKLAAARASVFSMSAKQALACSSNSAEMSFPLSSVVVVWPASHIVFPPSLITTGENARLRWYSVPSKGDTFAGVCRP